MEKDKYCTISSICRTLKSPTRRNRWFRGMRWRWGIGEGGQMVQTSSYKIRSGDVMYSMVSKVNDTVLYLKIAKRVNPKTFLYKEKKHF